MDSKDPRYTCDNIGMKDSVDRRKFAVAPMMDWTDRHCRVFHRLLAPHAFLFTEMVVAQAVIHGDRERLLGFDESEHPLALQVGGSDPALLAEAASIVEQFGYDELNLNVGCPSSRVQSGRFGACLMAEPALVADCYRAMAGAVSIPVTVKTRIGIDDHDDYDFLRTFVSSLADAGCRAFYVHARKAILEGLSPKQNREVPPLRHDMALRLKRDFAGLQIVLNGGLRTPADVRRNLASFDGVMIGREAYNNPYVLALIENDQYGTPLPGRDDVVDRYLRYVDLQLRQGIRLHAMTRHILGLYAGEPGARFWRRALSEGAAERSAGLDVIERARAARLAAAA